MSKKPKKRAAIPAEKWEWFGMAGHLIVCSKCQHHLCTRVGRFMVSTVGNYYPDGKQGQRETIGCDRFFETFVFDLGKKFGRCKCGCNVPIPSGSMSEIDSLPANNEVTADKNHIRLCRKYASLSGGNQGTAA